MDGVGVLAGWGDARAPGLCDMEGCGKRLRYLGLTSVQISVFSEVSDLALWRGNWVFRVCAAAWHGLAGPLSMPGLRL